MTEPGRRAKSGSWLVAIALGLVVGVAYPYIDRALACRLPASEACVWGKAYFPLTLALSIVLLGGVTSALVYAALAWRQRRKRSDHDASQQS